MFDVYRLKDINVDELIGNNVCVKALATKVDVKPTKNGSEYLNISINDNDVKVNCKMWNPKESDKSELVAGKVYEMTLSVESWDGRASCVLKGFKLLDENTIDYVERIKNGEKYWNLMQKAIGALDPEGVYYAIVISLINPDIMKQMLSHPAASGQHHNIIGGLMMHTATMLQSGYALAQVYGLDRDLIMASIILHDLEKLRELSCNIETGEIKYTTDGSLFGHIVMGAIEIDKAAEMLGVQNTEEVKLLKHCILAHHGRREWGSPVEPATREALVVHYVDSLDAEMYKMGRMLEHMEPGTTAFEFGKVVYKQNESLNFDDDDDSSDSGCNDVDHI